MAIKKRKNKLIASNVGFIAPLTCGSTVGYKIVEGSRQTWAEVDLTDCNRKIQWSFSTSIEGVEKIDKAIALLTEFRAAWVEAVANRPKPRTRRKKVNATTS